jgi:lysophospholipase L1-like esterase
MHFDGVTSSTHANNRDHWFPRQMRICGAFAVLLSVLGSTLVAAEGAGSSQDWVHPMREVHGRFKGTPGTFAHFGDSITVTLAFWSGLEWKPKNLSPDSAKAYELVKRYQKPECWRGWKGPDFGNQGSMTIRWADENVDKWLAKLNPEVALIMFGSNDVGQLDLQEYAAKTRSVVERCLQNGTVVILSTMPPRSGHVEKSAQFAEAVRKLASELHVPLSDYHAEILKRRPDDWDGSLAKFKEAQGDGYQVPTLISRDGVHPSNPKAFVGDFSEEALRTNGFALRDYVTLMTYAEVVEKVCQAR